MTQPIGGALNPDIAPTLALLDDTRYDTIITCFSDATNVAKIENEVDRRWDPFVQKWGMLVGAVPGSHGTLTTYGNARNSRFSCFMGTGTSPTPPWFWAAEVAARDTEICETQPNKPRKGLVLTNCEAPPPGERFDDTQRNLLYYDGISSFTVDQSGRVQIDRLVTTYQTNDFGLADATYLAVDTVRNLAQLAQEYVALGARFGDALIVDDDQNVKPGIKVISSKTLRGELLALNADQSYRALVKDPTGFADLLLSEIDSLDPERLNANISSKLVTGLVTLAIKNSFRF